MKKLKKFFIMERIIYYIYIAILMAICLTSCAGTKKLQKSKIDSSVIAENQVSKKLDEKQTAKADLQAEKLANKVTESSENENEETVKATVNYDTSKPVIESTGKPPVASETTETKKKLSQKDSKIQENLTEKMNIQIETNRQLTQKIDSQSKIISSLKSKSEVKETPVSNWWKWLIAGMIIGSVLSILIYHFKWYDLAFNFIKKVLSFLYPKKL